MTQSQRSDQEPKEQKKSEPEKLGSWTADARILLMQSRDDETVLVYDDKDSLRIRNTRDGTILAETKIEHMKGLAIGDCVVCSTEEKLIVLDATTLEKKSELIGRFKLSSQSKLSPTQFAATRNTSYTSAIDQFVIVDVSHPDKPKFTWPLVWRNSALQECLVLPAREKESPLIVLRFANMIKAIKSTELDQPYEEHKEHRTFTIKDWDFFRSMAGMSNGNVVVVNKSLSQVEPVRDNITLINFFTSETTPISNPIKNGGCEVSTTYDGAGFALYNPYQLDCAHYWDMASEDFQKIDFDKKMDKCFVHNNLLIAVSKEGEVNIINIKMSPELKRALHEILDPIMKSRDVVGVTLEYTGSHFRLFASRKAKTSAEPASSLAEELKGKPKRPP